ncbi:MAG: hypothetical protein H0W09_06355 [Solirubrobacterales bacterium]|nr:hypothetical protein [Solirubrobacterales bacterium]
MPLSIAAFAAVPTPAMAEERTCRGTIGAVTLDNIRVLVEADYATTMAEATDLDNVGIVPDTPRELTLRYRRRAGQFNGRLTSPNPDCVSSQAIGLVRASDGSGQADRHRYEPGRRPLFVVQAPPEGRLLLERAQAGDRADGGLRGCQVEQGEGKAALRRSREQRYNVT